MTDVEEWKRIVEYESYEISNIGRVRRKNKNGYRYKTGVQDKDGYPRVVLYNGGRCKHFRIHRLVAQAFIDNPGNKPIVDHENGIVSDNSVHNLRWATYGENLMNANKIQKNTTSKFKGVCFHKRDNKWTAHIYVNYTHKNLGYFDREIDAAMAYNIQARLIFKDFALLNDIPKPIINFID